MSVSVSDYFGLFFFSLKHYACRKTGLSDADATLVDDMSPLEKYLVDSQELMAVRGKV